MYLNIEVPVITGGEVPCELQDSSSLLLLPSHQEPVLTGVNGREETTLSIAVLQRKQVTKVKIPFATLTFLPCETSPNA